MTILTSRALLQEKKIQQQNVTPVIINVLSPRVKWYGNKRQFKDISSSTSPDSSEKRVNFENSE